MLDAHSHYDKWFVKLTGRGTSHEEAAVAVIHRYLDGKPSTGTSTAERDAALWTSSFWSSCPDSVFHTEGFSLSLAKYFSRASDYTFAKLNRALTVAPTACKRAIRYSRVFLTPDSPRWKVLQGLLTSEHKGYRGFVKECRGLWQRYEHLRRDADQAYDKLADLPLLHLLITASVSAFKTELPPLLGLARPNAVIPLPEFRYPAFSEAVGRLLARRLSHCTEDEFIVTEVTLRECFRQRLYPLLLPHYADGGACARTLARFEQYIDAQLRLDAFRQREVIQFCFDHGYQDGHSPDRLDHAIAPGNSFKAWVTGQIRGQVVANYWQALGSAAFAAQEDVKGNEIPAREGDEATVRALSDLAVLHNLFGVEDEVDLGKGTRVRTDQACLAIEMAREHYRATLLLPFAQAFQVHGNWAAALREIIEQGMFDGLQQRYPLLFARHAEKLSMLRHFTATEEQPSGSDEAASALLAFWGNDLATSADLIHRDQRQLKGSFAELPYLKLGDYVFTLPWVLTTQDVPTAVVNNLRRVRPSRPGAKDETSRIEKRLANQLEEHGFRTVVGFEPSDGDGEPPGEIDLIASRDGHLFVFEIKSGYVRQTLEAAWHHRTSTLRKAGRQLQRKLGSLHAVFPESLKLDLGMDSLPADPQVHAWIIDTSPDFDRECFSGHLKVSMTEFLIALRDEAGWLEEEDTEVTLYPTGFSAAAFAKVITDEAIWRKLDI